ncbi:hypothetical protein PHYBLDRAFT_73668 [Phycomyces blakesleeanus NRRL 1555(-)]|uniref:Uncharacterized protein n=1 Tax=Phycomyces blakesleeanus (strain ATCC 8743b / DSM 1359 / FGSC 10004 / NBRC 33097 / NRRL 1555) TaxID=763407 RepID=A0A162ZD99_PHYB8|nr:hypothetical protein PHYBLDRAFT_73668 [Phycomyces blakesleeanus NRRL 1555(-)]OAD66001.1 hypothetical protein PHYBLDRAFT_73668 [Phycomyces blakesleeanus NRRL 1555(-)]|eukprot:XP_018284041.1 hypothetical protein PHYBLDRAFT_73668 [Phycomyces blakesleeanus NRRL 1555(-)]
MAGGTNSRGRGGGGAEDISVSGDGLGLRSLAKVTHLAVPGSTETSPSITEYSYRNDNIGETKTEDVTIGFLAAFLSSDYNRHNFLLYSSLYTFLNRRRNSFQVKLGRVATPSSVFILPTLPLCVDPNTIAVGSIPTSDMTSFSITSPRSPSAMSLL